MAANAPILKFSTAARCRVPAAEGGLLMQTMVQLALLNVAHDIHCKRVAKLHAAIRNATRFAGAMPG